MLAGCECLTYLVVLIIGRAGTRDVQVATMFAVMKDTDYATKAKFIENFWADWKPILGKHHVIQDFDGCDFTPIYNWNNAEKEKKKSMTSEVILLCFTSLLLPML
jgi:hypothetical protein